MLGLAPSSSSRRWATSHGYTHLATGWVGLESVKAKDPINFYMIAEQTFPVIVNLQPSATRVDLASKEAGSGMTSRERTAIV